MYLWLILAQLWTSYPKPGTLLSGNWQSCWEDGEWGERIFEYRRLGKLIAEFHMGPRNEFALYKQPQPDDHSHDSSDNLLKDHPYDNNRSNFSYFSPQLGLRLTISKGGGSRDECESYFVTLESARR